MKGTGIHEGHEGARRGRKKPLNSAKLADGQTSLECGAPAPLWIAMVRCRRPLYCVDARNEARATVEIQSGAGAPHSKAMGPSSSIFASSSTSCLFVFIRGSKK